MNKIKASLKLNFRDKKFFVLLLVVFIYLVVMRSYFRGRKDEYLKVNHWMYEDLTNYYEMEYYSHSKQDEPEVVKEYYRYILQVTKDIDSALKNGDEREFLLNRARDSLLLWNRNTEFTSDWEEVNNMNDKRRLIPSPRQYFGKEYDEIRAKLDFPEFKDLKLWRKYVYDKAKLMWIYLFNHDYELLNKGLSNQSYYSTKPFSFIYNIFSKRFALIVFIIALMLGSSGLGQARSEDYLKTELSISHNRLSCYRRIFVNNFITIILILLIPLLLMVLITGFAEGFEGISYPVLCNKKIMTGWKPDVESYTTSLNPTLTTPVGLSHYILKGGVNKVFETIKLIPLWKYLLISFSLILMGILFWLSLGYMISAIFKKTFVAQSVSIGILVLSFIPGMIGAPFVNTVFDLPSLGNVGLIPAGYRLVTYWQVFTLYLVGTIIFNIIGYWRFSKQDI